MRSDGASSCPIRDNGLGIVPVFDGASGVPPPIPRWNGKNSPPPPVPMGPRRTYFGGSMLPSKAIPTALIAFPKGPCIWDSKSGLNRAGNWHIPSSKQGLIIICTNTCIYCICFWHSVYRAHSLFFCHRLYWPPWSKILIYYLSGLDFVGSWCADVLDWLFSRETGTINAGYVGGDRRHLCLVGGGAPEHHASFLESLLWVRPPRVWGHTDKFRLGSHLLDRVSSPSLSQSYREKNCSGCPLVQERGENYTRRDFHRIGIHLCHPCKPVLSGFVHQW